MKKKKSNKLKKIFRCTIKECPLAFFLVASTLILTIVGLLNGIISGKGLDIRVDRPLFASIIAPKDGEEVADATYEFENPDEEEEYIPELPTEVATVPGTEPQEEETGYPTNFKKKKKVRARSPYYTDPGEIALTTDYPYVEVGEDYFDDALFIGDSRIEGLKLYSGLDNATFYSKEGTTIYKILSEKIVNMKIDDERKDVTIVRALKEKTFSKIYIMLGINELGYKTTEDFANEYKDVLDKLRRLQPEAKIFIFGIMNVTDEYSKENDVVNNDNINAKNVAIAQLADGMNIFYLDVNPDLSDTNGGMKKKYSWDGVHLKAEYYSLWVDFLKKHGIEIE